jgi:putative pyruvate formate lyase activating enzyme
MMIQLQEQGCHNINLVSPSHVIYPILEALSEAIERGLNIPLVYNTGGYDDIEVIRILHHFVDIYMPDLKFHSPDLSRRLTATENYPEIAQAVIKEMYRGTGDLVLDGAGVAQRGLLVRHLVLPESSSDSMGVLSFLADQVSRDVYVNIMNQYRPCYKAFNIPGLDRTLRSSEYLAVVE